MRSQEGLADSGSTDASRVIWHSSPSVIATALARRHRTGSLGRVEVTDRDIIIDADLGMFNRFVDEKTAQHVIGTRLKGLLT